MAEYTTKKNYCLLEKQFLLQPPVTAKTSKSYLPLDVNFIM